MKYEEARNEASRLVRKAKYEYERSIAINNLTTLIYYIT
jgi:hypothetical protein